MLNQNRSLRRITSYKADKPEYIRESVLLRNLLSGAWSDVSSDYTQKVLKAVENKNVAELTSMLDELPDLGVELRKAISKGTDAIVATLQTKAMSFWELHGNDVTGSSDLNNVSKSYQKTIRQMTANQVKLFAEKNPERIIHPEIARQIEYLKESELTRSVDVTRLSERMEYALTQDFYWENLSDTMIARQWHSSGIALAKRNDISKGMISGPTSYPICQVCIHLVGLEIDIDQMSSKLDMSFDLMDIDQIKLLWPFPRLVDVDNISRKELSQKGFMVPFHPRCRHFIVWQN